MRQYLCLSQRTDAHYIALSMFDDVFGEVYAKPIYVEKTTRTASALEHKCEERALLGRTFYSLIKNTSGTYRFNADIYEDCHSLLGLPFEGSADLAFDLMRLLPQEIKHTYTPRESYVAAKLGNDLVGAAISEMLQHFPYSENDLGLIGSLGIDPDASARDLDLVFLGSAESLGVAHRWVRSGNHEEPPLRHPLPLSLPTICSFFSAEPSAYPNLSSFRLISSTQRTFDLNIESAISPSFLNIQVYQASDRQSARQLVLVVRDPLSRDMISPGMRFELRGYPAETNGALSVLVTDVERQIPAIAFHGGGAECSSRTGTNKSC